MENRLPRILGAFAILFSLCIPLLAGVIAAAAYTPMVNHLNSRGGPQGPLANFFFQNFSLALAVPLIVGVIAAVIGCFNWRVRHADATQVLGKLLVVQTVAALGATLWLGAFILGYAIG